MEDQLLMTLEYWREYRTYFHTALPAIMECSFSPYPSPSIPFRFEDVPHSCRKCCMLCLLLLRMLNFSFLKLVFNAPGFDREKYRIWR
ncbi:transposase family protein [Nostoc sp.]